MCSEFESSLEPMNSIIHSLETITTKCELFLNEFNDKNNNSLNKKQINKYKLLLNKYKNQLNSSFGQQRSEEESDSNEENETISGGQQTGTEMDRNFGQLLNVSLNKSVEEIADKIVVKNVLDESSDKRVKRFYCNYPNCAVSSHSRANILAHLAKHTLDKDFHCLWPNCQKSFAYVRSLDRHIESCHLRKPRFKCCCIDCGHVFALKTDLEAHMNSETHFASEVDHTCNWTVCHYESFDNTCHWPTCGKQFDTHRLLVLHMEEIHLNRTPVSNKSQLESNTTDTTNTSTPNTETPNTEEREKLFKCDHKSCNFETNYEQHMKDHKLKHNSGYVKLNNRRKLNSQQKLDESDELYINKYTGLPLTRKRRPKNYVCDWPSCQKSFEAPNALKKHMRTHTGEKPFVCDWPGCDKTFRFKGALKLHKEMIHLRLKQFSCAWPGCDLAFVSLKQLQVHKTNEHTGVKKYRCDWPECNYTSNHSQVLKYHKMRKHEGIPVRLKRYKSARSTTESIYDLNGQLKKYGCDWPGCDRRFTYESSLTSHLEAHQKIREEKPKIRREKKVKTNAEPKPKPTGLKKFVCNWPECDASYLTKYMLTQHINAKHTGRRPYQCPECTHTFPYQNSMRKHIQNCHQVSEKPYRCHESGCNRSFMENRGLILHQSKAHGIRVKNKIISNNNNNSNNIIGNTGINVNITGNNSNNISNNTSYESNDSNINDSNVYSIGFNYAFDFQTQTNKQLTNAPISSNTEIVEIREVNPNTTYVTPMRPHKSEKSLRLNNAFETNKNREYEYIAQELPYPCTYTGCWRRFKTEKALDWHKRKFHPIIQNV